MKNNSITTVQSALHGKNNHCFSVLCCSSPTVLSSLFSQNLFRPVPQTLPGTITSVASPAPSIYPAFAFRIFRVYNAVGYCSVAATRYGHCSHTPSPTQTCHSSLPTVDSSLGTMDGIRAFFFHPAHCNCTVLLPQSLQLFT